MKIKPVIILILIVATLSIFLIYNNAGEEVLNNDNNQGIIIQNIVADQEISSPLAIKGSINGNGWTAFEAVCGRVDLEDSNGGNIASASLNATSEWMTLPVDFESTLIFETNSTDGFLVFHNDNASGDPERDKVFKIPVKINASDGNINFNKTGNLIINNPGFEKDTWYLVYEAPGQPALSVKLDFSVCTDGCSDISSGDRVTISGTEENGTVLVRKLDRL